jgi:hypothetical protein
MDERSSLGFLISALGAAVLGVSVFLPWYGVSITAAGAATAQQQLSAVAQQYGNSTLQAGASQLGAEFNSLAGHQLATVSGHDSSKHLSLLLLLLAGITLLAALLRLAGVKGLLEAGGGQVAVAGVVAALFVGYRMLVPPGAETDLVSLSLSWGIWLALLSAAAIIAGGLMSAGGRTRQRPVDLYDPQL